MGPSETSTWVSVPDSSLVSLGPLGQGQRQVGRNMSGLQAVQPELGSGLQWHIFGHFVPRAMPGRERSSRLGVRLTRGVGSHSQGGAGFPLAAGWTQEGIFSSGFQLQMTWVSSWAWEGPGWGSTPVSCLLGEGCW